MRCSSSLMDESLHIWIKSVFKFSLFWVISLSPPLLNRSVIEVKKLLVGDFVDDGVESALPTTINVAQTEMKKCFMIKNGLGKIDYYYFLLVGASSSCSCWWHHLHDVITIELNYKIPTWKKEVEVEMTKILQISRRRLCCAIFGLSPVEVLAGTAVLSYYYCM